MDEWSAFGQCRMCDDGFLFRRVDPALATYQKEVEQDRGIPGHAVVDAEPVVGTMDEFD